MTRCLGSTNPVVVIKGTSFTSDNTISFEPEGPRDSGSRPDRTAFTHAFLARRIRPPFPAILDGPGLLMNNNEIEFEGIVLT